MFKRHTYVCPACGEPNLLSEEQSRRIQMDRIRCFECRYIFKASEHKVDNDYYALNTSWQDSSGILSRIRQGNVRQYTAHRMHPVVSLFWVLVLLFFVLLLGFQVRVFMLDRLSQNSALRPYLEVFCHVMLCDVPPRRSPYQISVQDVQAALPDRYPDGLSVAVTLENQAPFEQPFPALRLILSDEKKRIVGRRVYQPEQYLKTHDALMSPSGKEQIMLELAQPHEEALEIVVAIELH